MGPTSTPAPGTGCELAAGATYFIVVRDSGSGANNFFQARMNSSTSETLEPDGNGWSLANGTDYHLDGRRWLAEYDAASLLLVSPAAD